MTSARLAPGFSKIRDDIADGDAFGDPHMRL